MSPYLYFIITNRCLKDQGKKYLLSTIEIQEAQKKSPAKEVAGLCLDVYLYEGLRLSKISVF